MLKLGEAGVEVIDLAVNAAYWEGRDQRANGRGRAGAPAKAKVRKRPKIDSFWALSTLMMHSASFI